MTLKEAQRRVDDWIRTYGVRRFSNNHTFVLGVITVFSVDSEQVIFVLFGCSRQSIDKLFSP